MSKEKTKFLDKPFIHNILGTDPSQPNEMQPKEVLSYSFAGFGQNLICALVTSFFLFFLTDAIGFNPMWLAWMFLGARLFDAFNDPIMGTIVDRTRTKDGKMRPYLKATPIPIAIMTILLFIPFKNIIPNETGAFVLATVIYVVWSVCYTIVDVPYWGLASSMTKDTDKRNTMLTVARLFCTLGAGIVTVFIPFIQGIIESSAIDKLLSDQTVLEGIKVTKDMIISADSAKTAGYNVIQNLVGVQYISLDEMSEVLKASGPKVVLDANLYANLTLAWGKAYKIFYIVVAAIIAIVSIPTFWIGYKNTKERYYDEESGKSSLKHNVKLLGKNKPIIMLILVGVFGALRLIYMTSGIYYAKYNLGEVGLFSIMTLLVVPGGLIATLTTPYLSRKFGKRNVFLYSHLIGGIAMLAVYFIGLNSNGSSPLSKILFFVVLVLLGVPSGFSNILQYSMIADSVDYLEDKTGERAEGICFSMQTFISKIGMALTAFVTLLVLGSEDYNDIVSVGDAMQKKIWMMTSLFAAISTIACCIPLFFYNFTEKKQAEAVVRIENRKAAKLNANLLLDTALATVSADSYVADNKAVVLEAINTAKDALAKVFHCSDIENIMNTVVATDEEFFKSVQEEVNAQEEVTAEETETTCECEGCHVVADVNDEAAVEEIEVVDKEDPIEEAPVEEAPVEEIKVDEAVAEETEVKADEESDKDKE